MPPSKGYKTVLCKFWEINMCAKGSACTFAHGAEELERFTSSRPGGPAPLGPNLDAPRGWLPALPKCQLSWAA